MSSIPPHVEYHLSEPGLRIPAKIRELIEVVYDELPAIMAFRAANTSSETPA